MKDVLTAFDERQTEMINWTDDSTILSLIRLTASWSSTSLVTATTFVGKQINLLKGQNLSVSLSLSVLSWWARERLSDSPAISILLRWLTPDCSATHCCVTAVSGQKIRQGRTSPTAAHWNSAQRAMRICVTGQHFSLQAFCRWQRYTLCLSLKSWTPVLLKTSTRSPESWASAQSKMVRTVGLGCVC